MKNVPTSISNCRNCRSYSLTGRRGGECQRLDIPVQGGWKACSLAIPALSKWEDWDLVMDISPIAVSEWALSPSPEATSLDNTAHDAVANAVSGAVASGAVASSAVDGATIVESPKPCVKSFI